MGKAVAETAFDGGPENASRFDVTGCQYVVVHDGAKQGVLVHDIVRGLRKGRLFEEACGQGGVFAREGGKEEEASFDEVVVFESAVVCQCLET